MVRREKVRNVKRKKLPLLVTISCVCFPTSVFGEEMQTKETGIGIGFRDEQPAPNPDPTPVPIPDDPMPYDPAPIDNVLPIALGQTRYQAQAKQLPATSQGTLPKTGEQQQVVFLRVLGLACIASCFWLFLFTRLREEEQENG